MNKGSLARKAALAFIATLTALAGLTPFAPGASAAADYTQIRYAGTDRFDTAALIAGAIAQATPTAVLARADIYPDALTGAFAAAANGDGPMLLTRSDSVPSRTLAALEAEGVDNVILLGGPQAIWESVETQLEDEGYTVDRIFGATRYQTAIEIAEDGAGIIGTIDGERTALLSSGENFPDALSGAPLSFAAGLPSLLTPADLEGGAVEVDIFNEVVDTMNGLNIDQVLILGGPSAVSEDIEETLVDEGFNTSRIHGGDRHSTSVEVFEFGLDKGIYTNRRFGIARSDTFPDALAYAPLAGRSRTAPAPSSGVADTGGAANGLLLTPSCALHSEVEEFILENQATWTQGEILGGEEAICEEVADEIEELASVGRVNIDIQNRQVNAGGTINGRITGENIATVTVSGCGFNNQAVTRDAEGDFSLTLPSSQTTDCTLTFTTTFTDGSTEIDQVPIDVVAPGDPDVTLNPTGGPSGSQTTATYSGNRPAEITGVSSPNCTISNQGTQTNNRTFTVSGNEGTACTIVTTVRFTDTEGGTGTFEDTYTLGSTPTGGAAASVRPELVSASIGATSGTGTLVTYCFDEEVTGANAPVGGLFHVYTFDGDTQHNGSAPAITAENNNCVRVNIATITTTAARDRLSVATVDFGAVTDNEGSENPIGDAALGAGQETTLSAGVTSAPDLLSVTGCAPEPSGAPSGDTDGIPETRCTFTFDERAFTVNPAGFHLVLLSGDPINCVAIAGVEGGMPTDRPTADADTTIVAECQQTAASGPIATSDVARGYVDPNTVSDDPDDQALRGNNNQAASNFTATEGCDVAQDDFPVVGAPCEGNLNPLQATDTPDESTPDPDLVSATLEASDSTRDRIIYDFDETVQATGLDAADFCFYNAAGDQFCGTGTQEPITRGADDSTVVVTFANGALGQAVGASVLDGAVLDVNSRPNEEDEEGMANANQSIISAGRTDNPDLISVAIQTVTDTSSTTFQATYAFDEDIDLSTLAGSEADNANAGTVGDFFLIAADGTRYVATACETRTTGDTPAGTEDSDHTVRCTRYAIANAGGGSTGVVPTTTALMAAVVGTVDNGAVNEEGIGTGTNPEGAERTSGGTGTAAA